MNILLGSKDTETGFAPAQGIDLDLGRPICINGNFLSHLAVADVDGDGDVDFITGAKAE